jgi:tetratricopeptide (TPR) repeat protein
MAADEKIGGYYSEQVKISLGTGATKRQTTGENIFLVRELPNGTVEMSLLNMKGEPTNIREVVDVEEFRRRCTPKKDYLPPAERLDAGHLRKKTQADKHASRGNLHLKRKEYNSAEFEYDSALKLDEENVRAHYGLGKLHLEQGNQEKAREIFRQLSQIEALFEEDNKHIFNEFGIDLRLNKMYDEAIANYTKALEISTHDPVLHFNLARAYIGKEMWSEALSNLEKALTLKKDFPEAAKLMKMVEAKNTAT